MSYDRTIYCDGPDCGGDGGLKGGNTSAHVQTASPPPHIPTGFIETREQVNGEDFIHHFCGWDCVMKFAAKEPLPEVIEWPTGDGGTEG